MEEDVLRFDDRDLDFISPEGGVFVGEEMIGVATIAGFDGVDVFTDVVTSFGVASEGVFLAGDA